MKNQLINAVLVSALLVACAKQKPTTEAANAGSESSTSVAESAIMSVTGAADEAEQAEEVGECNLSRFAPLLGSSTCAGTENDSTVTVNYAGCNLGTAILTGSIQLSFSSPSTCASWIDGGSLPTSGSVTATTEDARVTFANGIYIDVNSKPHPNYLGQTVQGGSRATFTATNRQVDILGYHRVAREPKHNLRLFDHSIYSTSPIIVSGYKFNGTRQISSGVVRVNHNIAEFTTEVTLSNLQWSTTCCHPVNGQVEYDLTGNFQGNYIVDFNTGSCNQVRVTKNGGTPELKAFPVCK